MLLFDIARKNGLGHLAFWAVRVHTSEGRSWIERALSSSDYLDDVGRARALCVSSALPFAGGEAERTSEFAGRAVEDTRTADDGEVLAFATILRGLAAT